MEAVMQKILIAVGQMEKQSADEEELLSYNNSNGLSAMRELDASLVQMENSYTNLMEILTNIKRKMKKRL